MKIILQQTILGILVIFTPLYAEIGIAPIFSDNMILQRDVSIPLRGTATDEKEVTVQFNGGTYASVVIKNRWMVELPAMPAGGSFEILIKAAKNTVTVSNVTFGDIWLCAGQSNMDSSIETYKRKFPELYGGHPVKYHEQIRIFRAAILPVDEPQEFVKREYRFDQGWYPIEPRTRTHLLTATGYFFGLHLAEALDAPIGLIQSACGGTPITAWMPPGSLEDRDEYNSIVADYQQAVQDWPTNKIKYEQQVKEWEVKKASGEQVGWRPSPPLGSPLSSKRPYALHNGMIAPLYELPIKGVLWYQGEGNARTRQSCVQYETLLKDLVAHWRANWGNESMPFLIVQLPGFGKATEKIDTSHNWPWMRESQKNIEDILNCRTVCTIDSGMQKDIHPPYKENVGKRLAYAAQSMVYKQNSAPQSPEYCAHQFDGESTLITLKNVGSGLSASDPLIKDMNYDDGEVLGFTVINGDGKYIRATGEIITKNKVRVRHPGISAPKSIRYGWENFPNLNLFGSDNMPAFPFRTDQTSPFDGN